MSNGRRLDRVPLYLLALGFRSAPFASSNITAHFPLYDRVTPYPIEQQQVAAADDEGQHTLFLTCASDDEIQRRYPGPKETDQGNVGELLSVA